jgi:hypothetical protein
MSRLHYSSATDSPMTINRVLICLCARLGSSRIMLSLRCSILRLRFNLTDDR